MNLLCEQTGNIVQFISPHLKKLERGNQNDHMVLAIFHSKGDNDIEASFLYAYLMAPKKK